MSSIFEDFEVYTSKPRKKPQYTYEEGSGMHAVDVQAWIQERWEARAIAQPKKRETSAPAQLDLWAA